MLKQQSDKKVEVNRFIYFFMQGLRSKAFLILALQCGVA